MAITLTISGTPYTLAQLAAARLKLAEVTRTIEGGYDSMSFHQDSTVATPTIARQSTVLLTIDGTNVFNGRVATIASDPTTTGWRHTFTCAPIAYYVDKLPITGTDGTGAATYDRSPLDIYYAASDAGLTVGEIITRILTVQDTADALDALGVSYSSLAPPTLDALTVADLANLDVVPRSVVQVSGDSLLATMGQLVSRYHPKYTVELTPDGVLRFRDIFDTAVYVPRTLTVAGPGGTGDPVTWPRYRSTTEGCYTRCVVRGLAEIEGVTLSVLDGTLIEAWSGTDESNWTYADFTEPKDAYDEGDITSVSAASVTVQSDNAATTAAANFWNDREAVIELFDPVVAGIEQFETRYVSSNTAMSAGGTMDVSWDSTWPITATGYTRYKLRGRAGGLNDVGRLYEVRDAYSGDTGLNTFIGSHLVARSVLAQRFFTKDAEFGRTTPLGIVVGGHPQSELPVAVSPVISAGQFRFDRPVVTVFGSPERLYRGYPTTTSDGLPVDVKVLALYSRGPLTAVVPADSGGSPQYEGTAYTTDGIEATKYLDVPTWMFKGDASHMEALARQHLDATKDVVHEGSIDWIVGESGDVPSWNYLEFGNSLNIAINGASCPLSAVNAPITSFRIAFNNQAGAYFTQLITIGFGNRRRPFQGDDLFVQPFFAEGSPIGNLSGGVVGGAIDGGSMLPNPGMDMVGQFGGMTSAMTSAVAETGMGMMDSAAGLASGGQSAMNYMNAMSTSMNSGEGVQLPDGDVPIVMGSGVNRMKPETTIKPRRQFVGPPSSAMIKPGSYQDQKRSAEIGPPDSARRSLKELADEKRRWRFMARPLGITKTPEALADNPDGEPGDS